MYFAKANAEAALGTANPIRNDTHPDKKAGKRTVGIVEVNVVPTGLWKGSRKLRNRQSPADRRDSAQNPEQQHPLVAPDVQDRESRRRQYPGPNHPCNHDERRRRKAKIGWHFLTGNGLTFVTIRSVSLILSIKEASARWKKNV